MRILSMLLPLLLSLFDLRGHGGGVTEPGKRAASCALRSVCATGHGERRCSRADRPRSRRMPRGGAASSAPREHC